MAPTLEVIEGPDAGRTVTLRHLLVIGREADADLTLSDNQVSRHHARLSDVGDGYAVEDLGSSNGTFINGTEIYGLTRFDPGDELLIGGSVIHMAQEQAGPALSAVRPVPPALAAAEGRPDFVERLVDRPGPAAGGGGANPPALESLVDRRVKAQARLAPLGLLALVVLVVIVFLATK
jgi:pSer/pThr/pTyr-binding forkhead associated (FHA) protein